MKYTPLPVCLGYGVHTSPKILSSRPLRPTLREGRTRRARRKSVYTVGMGWGGVFLYLKKLKFAV
jgi:hypothetical protein